MLPFWHACEMFYCSICFLFPVCNCSVCEGWLVTGNRKCAHGGLKSDYFIFLNWFTQTLMIKSFDNVVQVSTWGEITVTEPKGYIFIFILIFICANLTVCQCRYSSLREKHLDKCSFINGYLLSVKFHASSSSIQLCFQPCGDHIRSTQTVYVWICICFIRKC